MYNVERLKQIVQKPVLFFEVYYLGIVPQQIEMLKLNGDALPDRYEMHLSVSQVNDMREHPSDKWFSVGLLAKGFNLYPKRKSELVAILDFPQVNYLEHRKMQMKALERAGIKYILLEDNNYSFEDIRKIYLEGALFLLQTPEAFGIPILECLCCGTQIFSAKGWPIAWRISVNHTRWGEGDLPECFTEYDDEDDLVKKLIQFKNTFDLTETPNKVFRNFLAHYPEYYYGNNEETSRFLKRLKELLVK
jgi:hypothetical protein